MNSGAYSAGDTCGSLQGSEDPQSETPLCQQRRRRCHPSCTGSVGEPLCKRAARWRRQRPAERSFHIQLRRTHTRPSACSRRSLTRPSACRGRYLLIWKRCSSSSSGACGSGACGSGACGSGACHRLHLWLRTSARRHSCGARSRCIHLLVRFRRGTRGPCGPCCR